MKFRLIEAEENQQTPQVGPPNDYFTTENWRRFKSSYTAISDRLENATWIPYDVNLKNAKTLMSDLQSVDFNKYILIGNIPNFMVMWDKKNPPGTEDGGKRIGGHNTGRNRGGKGYINDISNNTFFKYVKEQPSNSKFWLISIDEIKKGNTVFKNSNTSKGLTLQEVQNLDNYDYKVVMNNATGFLGEDCVSGHENEDFYSFMIDLIENKILPKLDEIDDGIEDIIESSDVATLRSNPIRRLLMWFDNIYDRMSKTLKILKSRPSNVVWFLDRDAYYSFSVLSKLSSFYDKYVKPETHSKADWF